MARCYARRMSNSWFPHQYPCCEPLGLEILPVAIAQPMLMLSLLKRGRSGQDRAADTDLARLWRTKKVSLA